MAQGKGINTDQMIKIMTIGIIAILIIAIVMGIFVGLKYLLPQNEGNGVSLSESGIPDIYSSPSQNTPSYQTSPTVKPVTAASSGKETGITDSASIIESFTPNDPYYSPTDFNTTSPPQQQIVKEPLQVLYQNSFTMTNTALSLRAAAGKGPLVIDYSVKSTIGDGVDPFYSFLIINVTDFETGENVGQGGYARTYSIEKDQSIEIPRTGDFRIDIYGSGIDLDLKVSSGIKAGLTSKAIPQQTLVEEYPEDEWW